MPPTTTSHGDCTFTREELCGIVQERRFEVRCVDLQRNAEIDTDAVQHAVLAIEHLTATKGGETVHHSSL